MRGKDIQRPVLQTGHRGAEPLIQFFGLLPVKKTLAVGRVRNDDAAFRLTGKIACIRDRELDEMIDAGPDRVVPGNLNGPGIDVRGENPIFTRILRGDSGSSCLLPESGIEKGPVLSGEAAIKTRCTVQRGERRFNGDGSAASFTMAAASVSRSAASVWAGR